MKITILTLFPEMLAGPFDHSIIRNAKEKNLVKIKIVNIRDFGIGKHKVVDDKPYGGGVGMVMRVDVLDEAIKSVRDSSFSKEEEKVVLLDPRGKVFNQEFAREFSKLKHLVLVCGHYEGFDERIRGLIDQTISIGDYVLTGGEIPAIVITDSVTRLVGGVLKEDATLHESFSDSSLLEYPQYTRPRNYNGKLVPEVLVSGDHKQIEEWKIEKAEKLTKLHRPDLTKKKA